jgi:hypothetical protein
MNEIRIIRAFFTKEFVRIYQAYNRSIADCAVKNNKFISPPFKMERTTWIKPSFLWMMYRSGWALKPNQERILAIDISHEGFLWALENSCTSSFDSLIYSSEKEWRIIKDSSLVVIQWDPERDINMNKLAYRSIQIGLTPSSTKLYVDKWTLNISDITDQVLKIHWLKSQNRIDEAKSILPHEAEYSIPPSIEKKIGINKFIN